MAVKTTDLIKLVELLPEEAKQSAYDYLLFLSDRYQPTTDADITRAMRSAKASLLVEGLYVTDQEEALVLSRIKGEISQAEFLRRAKEAAVDIDQIKKDYQKEIQEFENKYGTLEALRQKENKTDKDRDDLDNWLFYLEQLKLLGQ